MTADNMPDEDSDERGFGIYRPGRFMWILENIKALQEPVPAKGHQGLWEWDCA